MLSLQNYTTYSMLSGVKEPKEWVARAKELGYDALGICDKNTMGGLIEFQQACLAQEIQPILGAEYGIVDDVSKKKEAIFRGTLIFYIKNEQGLRNLIMLNNFAHDKERGFYYRARLDIDTVQSYSEGLVCVVPHDEGYMTAFPTLMESGYSELEEIFGDDFYMGYNPVRGVDEVWEAVNDLKDRVPVVHTYNCHYPQAGDAHLYEVVRQIDTNSNKNIRFNANREVVRGFLPEDDAGGTVEEIKEKCNFVIPTGEYHMPDVDTPTGDLEADIMAIVGEGWKRKLCPEAGFDVLTSFDQLDDYAEMLPHEHIAKGETEEEHDLLPLGMYAVRLKEEFETISKMGFLDYFWIVWDICRFADEQEDDRGPARGSAAGSLFSYLLNITRLDPLRHGLLFERFLNPDRNDLPDIDLDFSAALRDKVKVYVTEKYGQENVALIGTYERMKIAGGVKAIAQAYNYGIPDNDGNIVVYDRFGLDKVFANQFVTQTARGEDELRERLEYKQFRDFYYKHKNWFDEVVMPLQETIVNIGIHAAGTVVTNEHRDVCLPCFKRSNGDIISQWRDRHCEARGYPKLDLLTIQAIDIYDYAKKLIEKRHGVSIPEVEEVPLDDPKALQIFQDINTDGIFQFKSYVQHDYLAKLQPTTFDELVAATALCRPGPQSAGADVRFVDIKHGRAQAEYECEEMYPITKDTKGLIIYQEQIMRICTDIAGMSKSEADYVRKACGKKKIEDMRKWEQVFNEGVVENGYPEELAFDLWDKIVAFAAYGFNKSHAAAYVLVGYYQAWIKARYPVEYWCATLKYATDQQKKYESVFNVKDRAVNAGIRFVYPNIEGFSADFEPASDDEIYWPLVGIKGIGVKAAEALTANGSRNSFDSMQEMVETLSQKSAGKGVMNILITAGFFDPHFPKPWEAAQHYYSLRRELLKKKNEEVPYDLSHDNLFKWQKIKNEAYGFMVSSWKDVAPFHSKVRRFSEKEFKALEDGTKCLIGGFVKEIKIYAQKNNNKKFWAKLFIEDEGEKYQVYAWAPFWMNELLDVEGRRPQKGQLIEFAAEKSSFNGRPQATLGKEKNYCRIVWDEYDSEVEDEG